MVVQSRSRCLPPAGRGFRSKVRCAAKATLSRDLCDVRGASWRLPAPAAVEQSFTRQFTVASGRAGPGAFADAFTVLTIEWRIWTALTQGRAGRSHDQQRITNHLSKLNHNGEDGEGRGESSNCQVTCPVTRAFREPQNPAQRYLR